jgi:ubiquinone/menaquinone biosynthesis C-methylase UbiE
MPLTGGKMSKTEHDWASKEYAQEWVSKDERRAADRETQFKAAMRWMAVFLSGPARVIDVGCGPGTFAQRLLLEFPEVSVVCADGSADMLDIARGQLAMYGDRVSYVQSDFSCQGWTDALPTNLDAVVSARAIHNLRKPKPIQKVYEDIFALLRPTGVFLNVERVNFSGEYLHQKYREIQIKERGKAPAMDGPGPTLSQQFQLLKRSGFEPIDCLWRDGNTAVICGVKPGAFMDLSAAK